MGGLNGEVVRIQEEGLLEQLYLVKQICVPVFTVSTDTQVPFTD